MAIEFSTEMLRYFDCGDGAYSEVTVTEFGDSQVTVSGIEKKLFKKHFGDKIERRKGSVTYLKNKKINALETFRRHPTGEDLELNLVYKTPDSNELRLYLKTDVFKPIPGDFWCCYLKDGDIWLTSMSKRFHSLLHEVAGEKFENPNLRIFLEQETDSFQETLNGHRKTRTESKVFNWGRDPRVSAKAIEIRGRVCELYPEFSTFTSRATRLPYIEAHHFVPMKVQGSIDQNLDVVSNICLLNPWSHRKIHHATFDEIKDDIDILASGRKSLIEKLELNMDDIYEFYS